MGGARWPRLALWLVGRVLFDKVGLVIPYTPVVGMKTITKMKILPRTTGKISVFYPWKRTFTFYSIIEVHAARSRIYSSKYSNRKNCPLFPIEQISTLFLRIFPRERRVVFAQLYNNCFLVCLFLSFQRTWRVHLRTALGVCFLRSKTMILLPITLEMGKKKYFIFLRLYLLKMSCRKRRIWHFWDPKWKNFWESMPPDSLRCGVPLAC